MPPRQRPSLSGGAKLHTLIRDGFCASFIVIVLVDAEWLHKETVVVLGGTVF